MLVIVDSRPADIRLDSCLADGSRLVDDNHRLADDSRPAGDSHHLADGSHLDDVVGSRLAGEADNRLADGAGSHLVEVSCLRRPWARWLLERHSRSDNLVDNHVVDSHVADNHAADNHADGSHAADSREVDSRVVGTHAVDIRQVDTVGCYLLRVVSSSWQVCQATAPP